MSHAARKCIKNHLTRRAVLKVAANTTAYAAFPAYAMSGCLSATSLAATAANRGLLFGSAVSTRWLDNRNYTNLISHHCAIVTAENAMKWKYLEKREGAYSTVNSLRVMDFAQREELASRGHCFVWNHDERMPAWLVGMAKDWRSVEKRQLTKRMWRHGAFLGRKFPQISSWDVVNEAIDPSEGILRDSMLNRMLGDRFIDVAFRIMKAKAPSAKLVYNETMSWEASPRHRNAVLKLLERLLKRNVPIDALGIQSHIGNSLNKPRDETEWRRFLEDVNSMGLDVILTELDCSDRNLAYADSYRRDLETAAYIKGYLDITLDFHNVRQVILWSIADKPSYMNRKGYPSYKRRPDREILRGHPFDEKWQPKPMYHAILRALKSAPLRTLQSANT